MILDKELVFTQSAGVVTPVVVSETSSGIVCPHVIDLGAAGNAVGGHELTLHVHGKADAITATSQSVQAEWETCPNSSFDSTAKVIAMTPKVPMVVGGGVMYRMKIMDGIERFNRVKLNTVVSGGSITSGGVNVFLTKEQ